MVGFTFCVPYVGVDGLPLVCVHVVQRNSLRVGSGGDVLQSGIPLVTIVAWSFCVPSQVGCLIAVTIVKEDIHILCSERVTVHIKAVHLVNFLEHSLAGPFIQLVIGFTFLIPYVGIDFFPLVGVHVIDSDRLGIGIRIRAIGFVCLPAGLAEDKHFSVVGVRRSPFALILSIAGAVESNFLTFPILTIVELELHSVGTVPLVGKGRLVDRIGLVGFLCLLHIELLPDVGGGIFSVPLEADVEFECIGTNLCIGDGIIHRCCCFGIHHQ